MKRLLFVFICSALLCFQCEDDDIPYLYHGDYFIKNATGEKLNVSLPYMSGPESRRSWNLSPNDSCRIFDFGTMYEPAFDHWPYHVEAVIYEQETGKYLEVSPFGDNTVFPARFYFNDAGEPGKQLFKESSWSRYDQIISGVGSEMTVVSWVFEITPEDIVPSVPKVEP